MSTTRDMSQWLVFNLGQGRGPDALLPPATLAALHDPITSVYGFQMYPSVDYLPDHSAADVAVGYGLGWVTSVYKGQ